METPLKDFVNLFVKKTFDCLMIICNKHNVELNKDLVISYMKDNYRDKSVQCLETLRKDVTDAGFGLPFVPGRLTALQRNVQNITLVHECTMFASEIFDHFINQKTTTHGIHTESYTD